MNYDALISAIQHLHTSTLSHAAQVVDQSLVLRNWMIGAWLVEFQQQGEDHAAYGSRLLQNVAADLSARGVTGCAVRMLERMREFYLAYPQLAAQIPSSLMTKSPGLPGPAKKSSSAMTKFSGRKPKQPSPLPAAQVLRLSWTKLIELIRLDDPWKRAFYENECLRGNWSVRQLQRQIGSLLYERTGLSTDKQAVIEHGRRQALEAPQHIAGIIRDPYILEFTGLADQPQHLEKDLEKALLDHLQAFLLELGTGFCFEARQKRITVGNEHDYIDLVFYHRALRCHLLIDLKVRAFRQGDAGQMNFYLNYWKANMMLEGDNPPVGLLLCADKDQTKVEYATGGLPHDLLVSRYLVVLPKPEELRAMLEQEQAVRLQQSQTHGKTKSRKKS